MLPDDSTRIRDDGGNRPRGGPALPAHYGALVGRVLKGAYRIEGKIGEGGMGVVYRATQVALGRPVAVKTIHVGSRIPPGGVDRFFREARLLSQLQHPNIVHIIDFGTEAGPLHFMVMELLVGEPLDAFVEARKRLPADVVLSLMEQICAGMTAAHQAHVIHRDLKPSNIHVLGITGSPRPMAKILDFGLGKLLAHEEEAGAPGGVTREGVMMGTTGYSAPEQLHGGPVDERADIYSLGAILYYLLAGRAPYRDEAMRPALARQLTDPPDPLKGVDLGPIDVKAVEAIIHKAMSVRPADRYAAAADLLAALTGVLRPEETFPDHPLFSSTKTHIRLPADDTAGPRPAPDTACAARPRRPWLVLGSAVALLAGVLALACWWQTRPRAVLPPGVTPTEITFGLSAPLSGENRELGLGIQFGIETYFKHVNAGGGVHGRKLRLVALDDEHDPDKAVANVRRLIDEEQVFAFIGNVGSPTNEAALPLILQSRRVLFNPVSGARFLRRNPPDRYVFNYRASYDQETAAIVGYLLDVRRISADQIAVFAQNDLDGKDGFEGVQRALRKRGRATDRLLRVGCERNARDLTAAVDALLAARGRIRAVVMAATGKPASVFIRQVKDAGMSPLFTTLSFVGSETLAESLVASGGSCAAGVLVTQVVPPFTSAATGVLRYREHLQTYFPERAPGFVSLEGHIAAQILVEGLRNAGREPTSESLVEGLEKIRDLDLAIGVPITFGPSEHQGSSHVWGTVLDEKGVYHDLDLE
jgi:serine/threonine protein kinase